MNIKCLIKKISLMLLTLLFITSNSINAAVITIGKDTKTSFINAQFYVLGNEKVPTRTSISGTNNGYIYANDLCTIKNTDNSKYWKVEYPIASGKKIAYVDKSYILNNLSYSKSIKINANETVYTKSDMKTKFGSVYTTDTITLLSPVKDGKAQILYNIPNGYKIGWITVNNSTDNPKPNLNSSYYTTPKNVFTKGQCTWYTWGRAWEKLGSKLPTESVKGYSGVSPNNPNSFMSDAKYWWYDNLALNKKGKGYNSGVNPKADSIIVWQRGKWGHVAYVEKVDGDKVLISESNYDGKGSYRSKWYTLQEIKSSAKDASYGYIYLKESYKANVKVKSVKLNQTSLSLIKGKTSMLKATISPSDATNKDVTWTSSNKKIATVDANGKVKGIKAGTATITVTTKDGSKKATCKVTITSDEKSAIWTYPVKSVSNNISQKFGVYRSASKGYHLGIDITKGSGLDVFAASNGKVSSVKKSSTGNGNCIVIEHTLKNGKKVYSAYAHLESISVNSGDKVIIGQKIGVMGSTGNSTGTHLHFTIFDKISSSPYGYGKAPSDGVAKDSTGRKFFEPLKVIESNGESIKL